MTPPHLPMRLRLLTPARPPNTIPNTLLKALLAQMSYRETLPDLIPEDLHTVQIRHTALDTLMTDQFILLMMNPAVLRALC